MRPDINQTPVQRKGGERSDGDVHEAATLGISGAASPLPHLDAIQTSFGSHDVSGTKAHTDGAASAGAGAMGASAFATGDHVAFAGAPSLHTAAHEAAHIVQQRAGVSLSGGVGQVGDQYEKHADAVADRVVQGQSSQDLLDQYAAGGASSASPPTQRLVQRSAQGVQDIIKEKANKDPQAYALELFQYIHSLGDDDIIASIGGLSQDEADEVLTTTGDANRNTATYRTMLLAMLASGDPGRVNRALQHALACDQTQQGNVLKHGDVVGLGQHAMWPFVELMLLSIAANDQQLALVRLARHVTDHVALFDTVVQLTTAVRKAVCDPYMLAVNDITKLNACFYGRFKVKVENLGTDSYKDKSKTIGVAALRRIYGVMGELPEQHVAGNPDIKRLGRYEDGNGISGYYGASGGGEVGLGFKEDKMDQTNTSEHGGFLGLGTTKDPLHGVDRFNKVVRHEVGHAVDANIDASGTYCTTAAGGGWKDYGADYGTMVADLIASSNGYIKALENTKQMIVMSAFIKAAEGRTRDKNALRNKITELAQGAAIQFSNTELTNILKDTATAALLAGFSEPWWNFTGVDVGAYRYHETYEGRWARYVHATRARQVSNYQYRAPGEWFAEAYAAYYEPVQDNQDRGQRLKDIDANTWTWFNDNVHDKITNAR